MVKFNSLSGLNPDFKRRKKRSSEMKNQNSKILNDDIQIEQSFCDGNTIK
jgi:hypothetical protein